MRVLPMLALAAVALAGCGEAETRRSTRAARRRRWTVEPRARPDRVQAPAEGRSVDGRALHDRRRRHARAAGHPARDRRDDSRPDYSPDGSLIVFERTGIPFAVYTVRPDGSRLRRVTSECPDPGPGVETRCEDGGYPAFLPDGKRIVYTRSTGTIRTSPAERSGSSTPTSSSARSTGPTRGCCSAPGRTRPSTPAPASRPTARSSSTFA